MDLLDRVSQETGDSAQAHQLGLFKPERGQASAMLLARMPPPLTPVSSDNSPASQSGT
jgi:hypothetical protein